MIENAKIFGLTHWEVICTAIMAAWHNGISRSYMRSKAYKNLLPEKLYTDLGKGALLLSIAESLDYSQTGPLTAMHASLSKKGAVLNLTSPILPSIELHQLKIVSKWFKKSFKKNLLIKIHQ
jgi:exopolyphosphatase/guanosine-5'-triphosphate,3'-diphosphate pyrophosphatase